MAGKAQRAAVQQHPGDFGNQRKDKQVDAIPHTVARMEKTLHQQEGEQRKGESADTAHQEIVADAFAQNSNSGGNKGFLTG